MKKVIRLKSEFEKLVHSAEEILVATAMITDYGLSQFDERNEGCLFQILVGIDLPTQPSTLQKMYDDEIEVRVHNVKGQFFHPKVYLFNKGEKWTAFVGSGNCTMGGVERNIEMSIKVEDEATIKELIHWFGIYYDKHSQELTQDFIDDYRVMFNSRKELEDD